MTCGQQREGLVNDETHLCSHHTLRVTNGGDDSRKNVTLYVSSEVTVTDTKYPSLSNDYSVEKEGQ